MARLASALHPLVDSSWSSLSLSPPSHILSSSTDVEYSPSKICPRVGDFAFPRTQKQTTFAVRVAHGKLQNGDRLHHQQQKEDRKSNTNGYTHNKNDSNNSCIVSIPENSKYTLKLERSATNVRGLEMIPSRPIFLPGRELSPLCPRPCGTGAEWQLRSPVFSIQ